MAGVGTRRGELGKGQVYQGVALLSGCKRCVCVAESRRFRSLCEEGVRGIQDEVQ